MEILYREGKQHQPQSNRTCSVYNKALQTKDSAQVFAPTTSYSEEYINDVDENLGKPNLYMIVMGDFDVQTGNRTNPMETVTDKFGLELRN